MSKSDNSTEGTQRGQGVNDVKANDNNRTETKGGILLYRSLSLSWTSEMRQAPRASQSQLATTSSIGDWATGCFP